MALLQGYIEGMIQSDTGSDVTYTPILENGVASGKLTIGEEEFTIYSSKTEVTPIGSTGTKIATITIDGEDYDIYSQSGGSTVTASVVAYTNYERVTINVDGVNYIFDIPHKLSGLWDTEIYSATLQAGDVLTWDGEEEEWTNMPIPSSQLDYSTTEQNTGKKWIDGRPIYQKTFYGASANSGANLTLDSSFTDSLYDNVMMVNIRWGYTSGSNHFVIGSIFGGSSTAIFPNVYGNGLVLSNKTGVTATDIYITLEYTKVADLPPTP